MNKFKDATSLEKGYVNLEKEFTKKCQELSELKRKLKDYEQKEGEEMHNKSQTGAFASPFDANGKRATQESQTGDNQIDANQKTANVGVEDLKSGAKTIQGGGVDLLADFEKTGKVSAFLGVFDKVKEFLENAGEKSGEEMGLKKPDSEPKIIDPKDDKTSDALGKDYIIEDNTQTAGAKSESVFLDEQADIISAKSEEQSCGKTNSKTGELAQNSLQRTGDAQGEQNGKNGQEGLNAKDPNEQVGLNVKDPNGQAKTIANALDNNALSDNAQDNLEDTEKTGLKSNAQGELNKPLENDVQNADENQDALEKVEQQNEKTQNDSRLSDRFLGREWRKEVLSFVSRNPSAKPYLKEMGKVLLMRPELASLNDCLDIAFMIAKNKPASNVAQVSMDLGKNKSNYFTKEEQMAEGAGHKSYNPVAFANKNNSSEFEWRNDKNNGEENSEQNAKQNPFSAEFLLKLLSRQTLNPPVSSGGGKGANSLTPKTKINSFGEASSFLLKMLKN